jgi:hypothetical protein
MELCAMNCSKYLRGAANVNDYSRNKTEIRF